MHEYSLIRGLLGQVDELRRQHRADHVTCVRLTVGEFSGVEPDLLQTAFADLSQETAMEGATLEVTRTSLTGHCTNCERDVHIKGFQFVCPFCGSASITIQKGEELLLESVTMKGSHVEEAPS